jgi:1,4-dihydroxy-2-naphthoate octaprenyltransferase
MKNFSAFLGIIRAPFLILAPVCVSLGIATAYWQTKSISWGYAALLLVGGVSAHICVNVFNEYFDFHSGLDIKTNRTPFSGGSGTLPKEPALAKMALMVSIGSLLVTAVIGLFFVFVRGWLLLPLGIFGLFLLVAYTPLLTRNPVTCLLAPGLGFGILMVMGTHFALTGTYTYTSFLASLLPSFLVSNLLLLNQFPDVEADRSIGRKHFPILIGRKSSSLIYGSFLAAAYLVVIVCVLTQLFPPFCLLACLTSFFSWQAFRGSRQNAENIPALIPAMGLNVIINLTTPVLLAVGFMVGG